MSSLLSFLLSLQKCQFLECLPFSIQTLRQQCKLLPYFLGFYQIEQVPQYIQLPGID